MIFIRPVTSDNYIEVLSLVVSEDQKRFVADNAFSLAQAYVYPEATPVAFYSEETCVGFAMYGFEEDEMSIDRFMIDHRHQGKGYGHAALDALIRRIQVENEALLRITLSFEPENEVAKHLYIAHGFVLTGEIREGEAVAVLDLTVRR